jgi:hypothetical protein
MSRTRVAIGLAVALAVSVAGSLEAQQNPIARQQPKGLGVTPNFEGWYQNPDGTYTLSFGVLNRNTQQVLDIPVGEHNMVSPGAADQGQPTHFEPGRQYGIFAVTVPADFGPQDRVTWTLDVNGEHYAIPGGLLAAYETANLYAAATDEKPPVLVLDYKTWNESRGPNGERVGPMAVRAGQPLALQFSAWDEYGDKNVTVRWFKYRGPGDVTFDPQTVEMVNADGATTVTFSRPGNYVLYARADKAGVRPSQAGLEQCCWTNGYVSVAVTAGEGGR